MVPGHVVGSLSIQVKTTENEILCSVHVDDCNLAKQCIMYVLPLVADFS